MKQKPIIAIMYDFDKTLSTTDMQNYEFIPRLGMTPAEFWGATDEFSKKTGCERILAYMYTMIAKAKEKGVVITKEYLKECGKAIKYYPGVTTWFKRINEYGLSKGIIVEHYLVSSGTKEIVEGCSIIDNFTEAWACEYYFDEKTGEPVWPKLAINYTQKTQYFFRIAKGAVDIKNDEAVNEKKTEHRVPYSNIIYMGDGMTDIACMTLVKKSGGKSIAVHPKLDNSKVKQIYTDNRCNVICPADYSANSPLENVIKLYIDLASATHEAERKEKMLSEKE